MMFRLAHISKSVNNLDKRKSFRNICWVMAQIRKNRFWKKFPKKLLGHQPDFSTKSTLNSNIIINLFKRFATISCLGAPTRFLLMPRDPFQLSSVVTSQYGKKFFWKKLPENPQCYAPNVCLYGLYLCGKIFDLDWY